MQRGTCLQGHLHSQAAARSCYKAAGIVVMAGNPESRPTGDGGCLSDKIQIIVRRKEDGGGDPGGLERVGWKQQQQQEGNAQADKGGEPAQGAGGRQHWVALPGRCSGPACEEEEGGSPLFQDSSTLPDGAQSLQSHRSTSSRKTSPVWKHFLVSPWDSTKATCRHCMKKLGLGKKEKDLSTRCLMRHMRLVHPTVLNPEEGSEAAPPSSAPTQLLLPQPSHGRDQSPVLSPILSLEAFPQMASKILSPDQLAEETVTSDVRCDEASSSLSRSDKYCREEALGEPPALLPTLHDDDALKNAFQRRLLVPQSKQSLRKRSVVWQHFYLSRLDRSKAICIHCMKELSLGRSGRRLGTSCLIRHLRRAHKTIKLQENEGDPGPPPLQSELPALLPALPPPDPEPSSVASSLGNWVPVSPSALSSPHQLPEDLQSPLNPREKLDAGPSPQLPESGALFQQNQRVMKRLRFEVSQRDLSCNETKDVDVSLPPVDSLKAVCSQKTSTLWNHFSICSTEPTKVICLHCGHMISTDKKPANLGTSCLLSRHLQRFHSSVVLKTDVPDTARPSSPGPPIPMSTDMSTSSKSTAEESHPVAQKITRLVAEMMALDLQPYSLMNNVGFNRLLGYLNPWYSLPSPAYFSGTAIPNMYDSVKRIIKASLRKGESGVVHFTLGVWESSQTPEYLMLTAHWVTFESSVRLHCEDHHCSALLDVSQVDYGCRGNSLQKQMQCWWEAWVSSTGLQMGITVTDNPSIGKTLSEGELTSVQCFNSILSLILSEAFKTQRMVQNLLSIARKTCEWVQRSPRAQEKLAELQKEYALPQHTLIQDEPSKWTTLLHMLERLIDQKRAVHELAIECHFPEIISFDQWEGMQSVCHALRSFDAASCEMSTRTATLSQVIPMMYILHRKIDMLFEETMGIDTILKSLKEGVGSCLTAMLHNPSYLFATLLDPRYKTSLFSKEEAELYRRDLIRELKMLNPASHHRPVCSRHDPAVPVQGSSGKESLWSLLASVKKPSPRGSAPLPEDTVLAYLAEEVLEISCDPLTYWNLKREAWPSLSILAFRFLGCPPSIVPVEKLLNMPLEHDGVGRSRLTMEHFEKLIFLNVNLPLIDFQY